MQASRAKKMQRKTASCGLSSCDPLPILFAILGIGVRLNRLNSNNLWVSDAVQEMRMGCVLSFWGQFFDQRKE
jgi:hypothetical protein